MCYNQQVLLTGYEITTSSQQSEWSNWALVLKEVSHLLLISYSALNPLAYCGELIWKHLVIKLWHSIRRFCFFCRHGNSEPSNNIHTEGMYLFLIFSRILKIQFLLQWRLEKSIVFQNIYTYYLRYNDEIRWDNAKWSRSYATTVKRIRYLYVNLIVMIICALIWEFAKVSLLRHLGYIIKKF